MFRRTFIRFHMIRYTLLFLSLLAFGQGRAQNEPKHLYVFKDRNYLCLRAVDLSDAAVLDSSQLVATYRYSYQKELWNPLRWSETEVVLQIGARWSKCFPAVLRQIDEQLTRTDDGSAGGRGVFSPRIGTVYENLAKHRLSSEHRYPFSDRLIRYDEPADTTVWRVGGEAVEVLGYACIPATATFRGREWTIWFAPDLPAAANLWLFRGVPGLILRAETAQFRFECTAIRPSREAILQLKANGRKLSRERWRSLERHYHEEPYRAFNNNDENAFFEDRFRLNGDNWTIEYNPIELE